MKKKSDLNGTENDIFSKNETTLESDGKNRRIVKWRFYVNNFPTFFAKFLFKYLPFLRSIETSLRFSHMYKQNFGNIKFQGQYFQDMLAYLFFQKKKEGFFIDIGANDGITGSNTYIFEQVGWHGVCIEPNPVVYSVLKKYRKCKCYNIALSSATNEDVDFFKAKANALSGLCEGMSESHKQWAGEYGKTEVIKVKTMTFEQIMADFPEVKHIDFMSIDVEGHEIPILQTINFQKYTFGLLTIEMSDSEKIKEIMSKNGYKVFMEIGEDTMFIPQ